MRDAFPWDEASRYVRRDRDAIYGGDFAALTRAMGMEEVLTAPRCPWQNPFVERLVGSIRRECLDHVIVWNERSLRRTLQNYFAYLSATRRLAGASRLPRRLPSGAEMPLLLDLRDQTFANQKRILSRHELPALGCTRRLDEAETASFWTPMCLPTRKGID
jgi:transposase InsO family protein